MARSSPPRIRRSGRTCSRSAHGCARARTATRSRSRFPTAPPSRERAATSTRRCPRAVGRAVTLAATAHATALRERSARPRMGGERRIHTPVIEYVDHKERCATSRSRRDVLRLGTLHLVTTASLDRLERANPGASFDLRRFRPNLLLDVDAADFDERSWAGQTLAIGDQVRIEVTAADDTLHHDHAGAGRPTCRSQHPARHRRSRTRRRSASTRRCCAPARCGAETRCAVMAAEAAAVRSS